MSWQTLRTERDDDGIVTVILDDPAQSANTLRAQFVDDFDGLTQHLVECAASLKGVILTSAKSTFFAGGDLKELQAAGPEQRSDVAALCRRVQGSLIALETLGVPVVAALNGSALGGGLEIALACHHRVAIDLPKSKFGLPEVSLGLLPGGGGVVRTVRMLGVVDALMKVLLKGPQMRPAQALKAGLIDALVPDADGLLPAARQWIENNPKAQQPWRGKGYRIPGGGRSFAQVLPAIPAQLRVQMRGANYHAAHHIVAAAVEGSIVDVDRAFEIEQRYFVDLVCNSPQSKNMTQAFFFDLQAIGRGSSRPEGIERFVPRRVAVLGAGMMGAGIAYQAAKSGLQVVLRDVSLERAEAGKAYGERIVNKLVSRKRMTADAGRALLERILPTASDSDLVGCDLVIEAVFESPAVKAQVFQAVQAVVAPDAVLASHTSTLPITDLALAVKRPQDCVGLHFFSPVEKMPLVEIIRGERTSDATIAKAFDIVQRLKKTPIVVQDSRGFFTSRVIARFLNEAVAMLAEGISPVLIERAGLAAGYPSPPLQLMDELTLTLPRKIMDAYRHSALALGQPYSTDPAEPVLDALIGAGRPGRSGGAGFYEYADGERGALWPGLWPLFDISTSTQREAGDERLFRDVQDRMLFGEAIETIRCMDEGVLTSFAEANIGSIFGIGFPPWTGGAAQFVDQYEGGTPGFVARARELAARYGERFEPPASVVGRAERGLSWRGDAG
ncbi:MAG: 3-hydroxyacyl-CoA dehydrogenase NAD-binding domain-containing protein [Myxococcota bacterium]